MAATNTHSSYKETGFTITTLPIIHAFYQPPRTKNKGIKIKNRIIIIKNSLDALKTNQRAGPKDTKEN